MAFQSSTIVKRHAPVTHPTALEAEAEYIAANQERWEVADDLDAEQELDTLSERERFEQLIDMLAYELDGLLPE